MARVLFLLICMVLGYTSVWAQKKEIAQAQAFLKSGKSLDKAEQMMRKVLSDSCCEKNVKAHVVLTDVLRAQYEQSNEKLYLKKKVDTASVFRLAMRMFEAYEALDTLDAAPDKKGRVKIKYRQKNAAYLSKYRKNLFNGGIYFISKQQYADGYDFMKHYLRTSLMPLFADYHYPADSVAAYWALFCGYKLHDSQKVLRYANIAKRDTAHLEYTLQYLAETYIQKKDTAKYVSSLHEGLLSFKTSTYFFTYLVDYYSGQRLYNSAMDIVDISLRESPQNPLFLYAKSNLLLNMGRYEECVSVCDSLIARDNTLADCYYNAGAAWLNMAFETEHTVKKMNDKTRKLLKSYYQNALVYIEKYRALRPEDKDKWAAALYNIYLNLNMGKEFEEIDRLLRE